MTKRALALAIALLLAGLSAPVIPRQASTPGDPYELVHVFEGPDGLYPFGGLIQSAAVLLRLTRLWCAGTYQIRTRSGRARYKRSPERTSNAAYHGSRLRTVSARYGDGAWPSVRRICRRIGSRYLSR